MEKVRAIDWRFRPPYGSFVGGAVWPSDTPVTMDDCIREMDEVGVDIGVVPFRKGMDNADIAGIMRDFPGRFRVLAHIDPWDGVKGLEDIDRYVIDGAASGIIIEPGQVHIRRAMPADDEMLTPIYEKCQRDGVLVTISYGGMMSAGLRYYNPVFIDNIAERFPKLKIVVAHGDWPYSTEICAVALNHDNVYISADMYFAKGIPGSESYVKAANSAELQDRFIFGSVYPAPLKKNYDEYLSQLTPEALPKVMYGNAAKLLGIGE